MSDAPRLTRVLIEGLLDPNAPPIDIRLRLEDRVTILHGRNGSGKTRTLALLSALQRGALAEVRRAPLQRLLIELSDGSSVAMTTKPREPGVAVEDQRMAYVATLAGQVVAEGVLAPEDELRLAPQGIRALAAEIGWVELAPDQWLGPGNGETIYHTRELARHLGLDDSVRGHQDLTAFCSRIPAVKFIRADRLRTKAWVAGRERAHGRLDFELTVERLSEVIRQQVQATDEEYRLESTQLDSALRNRLLHMPSDESLPSLDELRERNTALAREQERLSRLGLMREEPSPIDADAFTEDNRRMLTLLLEDGEQKIKPFRRLADKAEQLLDTLNRKLAPKAIRLDVKTGYHVTSSSGHELPLSALSSGEQHELVLLHELLFEAEPDTLVLIDEPELSLHPTWQEEFLPDLLKIARLSELDFILATHSPYIIGERTDLMVRLGAPFNERP